MIPKPIVIGKHIIGEGHPCFIIAEAGSNHNGSLDQAKRMIDVAAAAGVDAVKFQYFRADKLYPKSAGSSDYLHDVRSIYDIIKAMELPEDWIPVLAGHCKNSGVEFLCSAFDEESMDALDPWTPAIKIASYEMTHMPLVRHAAQKKKPLLISTGTASLAEVAETVQWARQAGQNELLLLQCTARYPASFDALNVRAVSTLANEFGVWSGFSDHSRDAVMGPVVAVSVGAKVIEKHYTLDNKMDGPDHAFAIEPHELTLMVRAIRNAEQILGHGRKEVMPEEAELRAFARRSIFAVQPIRKGDRFSRDNVRVLRTGKKAAGLAPEQLDRVLGRTATREISLEQALEPGDVG